MLLEASLRCGDADLAEEAVQSAWPVAWHKLHTVRDPEKLRPLVAPGGCLLVFGGPELPGAEILPLPSGARLQRRCFT